MNEMEFRFINEDLERLATDASFTGGYATALIAMFRQTLQIVLAVKDESGLAAFECLKYKKISASRRRLALTDSADLLVRIQNGKSKAEMIVERISCVGQT